MKKEFCTVNVLFDTLWEKVEKLQLMPQNLEIDYRLVGDGDKNIVSDKLALKTRLDFGGSEGIYLDMYLERYDTEEVMSLGTVKTLQDSREAMLLMGTLVGALSFVFHEVLDDLDEKYGLLREGYSVYRCKKGDVLNVIHGGRYYETAEKMEKFLENNPLDGEAYFVRDLATGIVTMR